VESIVPEVHKNKTPPEKPPPIGDVVIWVAKLGGYLPEKMTALPERSPYGEVGSDLPT